MLQFVPDLTTAMNDSVVLAGLAAVLGGIVLRWFLRGHPAHAIPLRVGFLIAITIIALRSGITPYEPTPPSVPAMERIFIGATKLVWWTSAALLLSACVRVFLRFDKQAREARVIQDLVVGAVYVGAVLSIIAYVFGAPVGTLIATSGVFAIILGLALQSTLNDLFSGIALNMARPYVIGDWIILSDGTQGRVIESNWRATLLLNGNNDLVVLPNAQLARLTLTNRSGPDRSHGASLQLRVLPTRRPALIAEAMSNALTSATTILQAPAPSVQVTGLDADAVTIELSFRVADFGTIAQAKTEVLDLVFRHAMAADLKMASMREGRPVEVSESAARPPAPNRLVGALRLFASLDQDEKDMVAQALRRRGYRKGEVIARPGDALTSVQFVRSGVVSVRDESGAELRLAPGDYFGAFGMLTQAPETATFAAITNVVIYELDRPSLAQIIETHPEITEELAAHLTERAGKLERIRTRSGSNPQLQTRTRAWLVEQIRAALLGPAR